MQEHELLVDYAEYLSTEICRDNANFTYIINDLYILFDHRTYFFAHRVQEVRCIVTLFRRILHLFYIHTNQYERANRIMMVMLAASFGDIQP